MERSRRWAVSELLDRYGEDGLRACCLLLLFDHPAGSEYSEGIDRTALGIIYLLEIRTRLRALPPVKKPDDTWHWFDPQER